MFGNTRSARMARSGGGSGPAAIARPAAAAAIALAASFPAAGRVVLDAPGHVAVEGAPVAAHGGVSGAGWALLDWRGRETGVAGEFDAHGEAVLPPLPTGYYAMVADGDGERRGTSPAGADILHKTKIPARIATLAVVPDPESRPFARDSFFGIDTAQSACAAKGQFDCPWNGGDGFRTVSDIVRLAGFAHVRDRLSWNRVTTEPGQLRHGDSMVNAEMLRERGVGVSGMVQNTPSWIPGVAEFPSDLATTYDAFARFAIGFGACMEAWECWNEPDIKSAPVWDYAAAFKAAALGIRAGRPDAAVLPGALCTDPKADYTRVLLQNDVAKFADAFNFHTYANLAGYPELFRSLHAAMAAGGFGDSALWVTESGTNVEGPATDIGAKEGLKAHSPSQELVVAEFLPKSQILLMMEGAARSYFFVLCPYNERGGTKDWGAMRRDGTVKPVYAAMSAMTYELSCARLVGEMRAADGVRAFLFDMPDGSQTVAFWSVSPVDTADDGAVASPDPDFAREFALPLPGSDGGGQAATGGGWSGTFRLSDLCGVVSYVEAEDGALRLHANRFPAYVSGLHGLAADVPPRPAGRLRRRVQKAGENLSIILRVDLDQDDFEISGGRTCARMKGPEGRLRVQVWNLSDTPVTGRIEVSGATLAGLPESVALGPRGTPPAEFDCMLRPGPDTPASSTLVLFGVFDGHVTSRLAVPLQLDALLYARCEAAPLPWRDRARWRRNDSADGHSFAWDEAERAWHWDAVWTDPGANRWFYPEFSLVPGDGLGHAAAMRFEIRTSQDKVENDFSHCYCMVVRKGADALWLDVTPPVGSWESRVVMLRDLPPDVIAVRIGANPRGSKLSFWLRNLEVIRYRRD